MNFFRVSRQIPEKKDVCRFSIKFAKTNSKIAEILKFVKINNSNYSILFNFIQSCPQSIAATAKFARRGLDVVSGTRLRTQLSHGVAPAPSRIINYNVIMINLFL